jgi:IMP dehydrogenase
MTIKEQVTEVKKVKSFEDLTIRDVITISPENSIKEAHLIMDQEDVSGLPVVDNGTLLVLSAAVTLNPYKY